MLVAAHHRFWRYLGRDASPSPPTPTPPRPLADVLSDNSSNTNFPVNEAYWAKNVIDDLIQEDTVRRELSRSHVTYDDALVRFIVCRAKKLFSIAVLAPAPIPDVMKFFQQHGFEDSKLSTEIPSVGADSQQQSCSHLTKEKLADLDSNIWTSFVRSKVYDAQWRILIPIFSTERINYSFETKTVLPIKKVNLQGRLGGAFSEVHKVEIKSGHFVDPVRPSSEWPAFFAVKEIIPPDDDERRRINDSWANEVETLKTMNSCHKDHIIRCMTAFTRGDAPQKSYYMILDPITILRFGPTDDNILGTFKIGDWGLAKLHSMATVLRKEKGLDTTTKYGTPLYEPPEVQLGEVKLLSRQYDVWSMGCIILEIIIWLLYGYDGVKKFRSDVRGFSRDPLPCYVYKTESGEHKATLRPVVIEWLNYMTDREPRCDPETALGALLSLVRNKLLIVELPPEMGQTEYISDWVVPTRREPSLASADPPTPGLLVTAATSRRNNFNPRRIQQHRATSSELMNSLQQDVMDDEDRAEDYWFKAGGQLSAPIFSSNEALDAPDHLTAPSARTVKGRSSASMGQLSIQEQQLSPNDRTPAESMFQNLCVKACLTALTHGQLDAEWTIHEDNTFASQVLSSLQSPSIPGLPQPRASSILCLSCQKLDIFRSTGFSVEYSLGDLKTRSTKCDLCALFWKTARRQRGAMPERIRFDRVQSHLVLNNAGSPVLLICGGLDTTPTLGKERLSLADTSLLDSSTRRGIQIGLPTLPNSGSRGHFEIIRRWLQLCDDKTQHPNCQAAKITPMSMPTRLVDVGHQGEQIVRLWELSENDAVEYIALSHPWGRGPHFMTSAENIRQHKIGIRLADLPATFRDAVLTTRALGKRHLWIDSICIVQGRGGDFQQEATKMESVFSSAYCVLAASRAHNQVDGFLGSRRERDYVTMRQGLDKTPFYICENIDAFDAHVLGGHLHKRGWVLQEHALARRTIFFTEHQTYWECGDSVRCETLTKMSNNLAAFLGDPKFPRIIMSATQGEKIIRFQNLYKTYSALAFTNPCDRPIAVDGIQSRLLRAFGTRGGYGIFAEDNKTGQLGLLRRSLLWYRPENMELTRIKFPPARAPVAAPSWSWMAYTGEIDFLKLEFGKIDWMAIQSPWSSGKGATVPIDGSSGILALTGQARAIIDYAEADKSGKLYYDINQGVGGGEVRCVVLGVERGEQAMGARLHYFILVKPTRSRLSRSSKAYERVGAGYLPGRFIAPTSGEQIQIY
ncbi:hypothetical protein CHU98_g3091 [Xylaria longipes]|nr:hypothetical protein CHU98_g3091 [Xylaria longipes]